MIDALKTLVKQPYWIIALLLGVALVVLPCVTIVKGSVSTHPPTTLWPEVVGIMLLLVSVLAFGVSLWLKLRPADGVGADLDLSRVKESKGTLSTTVSGCEVRVIYGRVEEYAVRAGIAVVLPCNEYFDDRCVEDINSALGAYVKRVFEGQAADFVALMKAECRKKLGAGVPQQKTENEQAESFGAGKCLLLLKPLGRSVAVALVSTTTQRAGEGLAARVSYLFDALGELVKRLADERIDEVAMPILGAGHGRIDKPLAFVGLLLAIAEAVRYSQGGRRLKGVTVVVFQSESDSAPEIDRIVIKRALALIGS